MICRFFEGVRKKSALCPHKERTERKDLQSKEGKAEVATCQWYVFSNDQSEAETGKEFRNGFEADLFLQNYIFLFDYDVA